MSTIIPADGFGIATWLLMLVLLKHLQDSGSLHGATPDDLIERARLAADAALANNPNEATLRDAIRVLTPGA